MESTRKNKIKSLFSTDSVILVITLFCSIISIIDPFFGSRNFNTKSVSGKITNSIGKVENGKNWRVLLEIENSNSVYSFESYILTSNCLPAEINNLIRNNKYFNMGGLIEMEVIKSSNEFNGKAISEILAFKFNDVLIMSKQDYLETVLKDKEYFNIAVTLIGLSILFYYLLSKWFEERNYFSLSNPLKID